MLAGRSYGGAGLTMICIDAWQGASCSESRWLARARFGIPCVRVRFAKARGLFEMMSAARSRGVRAAVSTEF